ncbi:hypothetical protein [Streptomyces sp. NPDC051219]|uniref:hypothetical protein n=1 Tax=Streptomyces sp. NPDC051219 TaxID=3155283 RepID=UPI003415F296
MSSRYLHDLAFAPGVGRRTGLADLAPRGHLDAHRAHNAATAMTRVADRRA